MYRLIIPTEEEVKYFHELKSDKVDDRIISYIMNLDKEDKSDVESSGFKIPEFNYDYTKKHRVTANIATIPSRFNSLLSTLKSIDGQFDEIRIYLNGYKSVPDELKKYTTHIGQDLTDNGKFYWSYNKNEFYFTIDDDIIYPSDYVEKTIPLIKQRIVTYHGRILTGKNKNYYDNHLVYLYYGYLKEEKVVDVAGTGVMAFDTNIFKPNLWKSPNYKMSDLLISLEAHLFNIPIVCLPKNSHWITHENVSIEGIYWEFKGKEENQIKFADMIQTYKSSNINSDKINYNYNIDSIKLLSDFISKNSDDSEIIMLRFGNANLSENLSKLLSNRLSAYDSCEERVLLARELIDSGVEYNYVESLESLKHNQKKFIFLDDYLLPKSLSTNIYQNLISGSQLICSKIVENIFPIAKIEIFVGDELVPFYYYIKN